jgi:hypothetical protein
MTSKASKKTCCKCKKSFPIDECEKIGAGYYCFDCGEKHKAETNAYRELIDYICQLYGLTAPSMLILSQIKRFKEVDGFTYKGMKAALQYFFELQHNDVHASNGVGIIPYIYEEVKEFHAQKKRRKEKLKQMDWHGSAVNIVTVHREEEQEPEPELFDISQIGGEEDGL